MLDRKIILVTGATGGQGGAVARALIGRGWAVRALVRDPDQGRARDLELLGAELAVGDMDDLNSLLSAAQGAYGLFSVQPANLADSPSDAEVRRGMNVADAAVITGIRHLVYSSVGGAERRSGIAHFDSKAQIEQYIDALGVPATVLRPVFFMENWPLMVPQVRDGERVALLALDAETPLQMIALSDIGWIAAAAFADPASYIGTKIEIAGDELTVRQVGETITEAGGIPTRFERPPSEALRGEAGEGTANMFDWLNEKGFHADILALRARFPHLLTLRAWLSANWPKPTETRSRP
ncbi:NmrA/HSCARG family protein [Streptomyces sp. NPDC056480]|uniref:NmrA/HSCARG family protein n=1 Tax=Streptomyces sp. NPDC056480 TaxID=3345833 RepID=UPI003678939B